MVYVTKKIDLDKSGTKFIPIFNDNGITVKWENILEYKNNFAFEFQIADVKLDKISLTSVIAFAYSETSLNQVDLAYLKPTVLSVAQETGKMSQIAVQISYNPRKIEEAEDKLNLESLMTIPDTENILDPLSAVDISESSGDTISSSSSPESFQLSDDEIKSTLTEALKAKEFADVIFSCNDSKTVYAHRGILQSQSETLKKMFTEFSEVPITIDLQFPESTVTRAMEYCYGKETEIKNYEIDLIEFARRSGLDKLKNACLKSLQTQDLTLDSISDVQKVAIKHSDLELKQKCSAFVNANKAFFDDQQLAELHFHALPDPEAKQESGDFEMINKNPIQTEPTEMKFVKEGDIQKVKVSNYSGQRCAIKIKCSDNAIYRVNPVFAFIEDGNSTEIEVTRKPGISKVDKILVFHTVSTENDNDASQLFKPNVTYPNSLVIPLIADS